MDKKKIDFITTIQNIKGKIIKISCNDNGYYSYLLSIKNPPEDEKVFLYYSDKSKSYSIWLKGTKEQAFSEKQEMSIMDLGIEEYTKNDGNKGYVGHILVMPSIKDMYNKEASISKEPIKTQPTPQETSKKAIVEQSTEQKMWQDKELRDFRGRCIMYAIPTLPPRTKDDGESSEKRAEEIILIAETKFLEYIYMGWNFNERKF